jgi:hypothetical protein
LKSAKTGEMEKKMEKFAHRRTKNNRTHLFYKINNMSAEALESISTDDLMKEVQRRIDCAKKPEKRIILIGAFALSSVHVLFFRSFPCYPSFSRRLWKTNRNPSTSTPHA